MKSNGNLNTHPGLQLLHTRREFTSPYPRDRVHKAEEEGGCGVTGFEDHVQAADRHLFDHSIQMHNRGNDKGGGIAFLPGDMPGEQSVEDQAQIIKAQTAIAGVATTPPRSDGVMGLLLNGIPATDAVELDTDNPRSDLEFVTNNETPAVRRGLRVRANRPANAAAGDYPATGGETNPTLRTTGDKGLDVLLAKPDTGYENATDYAYLSAILAAGHVARGGLAMKLDRVATTGCLKWTTGGLVIDFGDGLTIASNLLKVLLASNPGLEFNGTELRVKVKSGGGITRDADGLSASAASLSPTTVTLAASAVFSTGDTVKSVAAGTSKLVCAKLSGLPTSPATTWAAGLYADSTLLASAQAGQNALEIAFPSIAIPANTTNVAIKLIGASGATVYGDDASQGCTYLTVF